jgi:O-6-methylguanine DNA methyltransferase
VTDAITDTLAGLRRTAPGDLLPAVLVATGIADGYFLHPGPAGDLFVSFNDHGVSALVPAGGVADPAALLEARSGRPAYPAAPPDRLRSALERTLRTGRLGNLPVDLRRVTPFQRDVLDKTAEIPAGEVRPYGWVAREIGRPGAVRAVGSALGANPVPIVVPCHRVVRTDGRIGDYAFGRDTKARLLHGEGVDTEALEEDAAAGRRYLASDTTRIFCHPTCRNARRITPRHRVWFRDPAAAVAGGYRPCKVCRPAVAA